MENGGAAERVQREKGRREREGSSYLSGTGKEGSVGIFLPTLLRFLAGSRGNGDLQTVPNLWTTAEI